MTHKFLTGYAIIGAMRRAAKRLRRFDLCVKLAVASLVLLLIVLGVIYA